MFRALTTRRRRFDAPTHGRTSALGWTSRGHRFAFESLEPRQMLSGTPEFHIVNDATANVGYRYSETGAPLSSFTLATANAAPRGVASIVGIEKTWVIDANRSAI